MNRIRKSLAVFAGAVLLASTAVAQILPDLTVKDVSLDDQSKITFELANESSDAIDASSAGFVYVYVDGKVAWTYNWKYLQETGFLSAEGNSIITSQIPKGGTNVKVCVDARENIIEADEANNCFTTEVEMEDAPAPTVLPDLAVTDLFVDPFTGQLTIEHGNIGKGRVPDYNGNVNIYVDGKMRWTYNYSSMNKQFLNPESLAKITPNKLRGIHEVTACTSTRSVIQEASKNNNCLTRSVKGGKVIITPEKRLVDDFDYRSMGTAPIYNRVSTSKPDFTVVDIYRGADNVIYAEIKNLGTTNLQEGIGRITFFLNGRSQKSYKWSEFADQAFLNANGSSVLPVYELMGAHEVRVCVDDTNRIREENENNNCFAVRIR